MYIRTHIYIWTYIYIYIWKLLCVCVSLCACVYVFACVRVCVSVIMSVCLYFSFLQITFTVYLTKWKARRDPIATALRLTCSKNENETANMLEEWTCTAHGFTPIPTQKTWSTYMQSLLTLRCTKATFPNSSRSSAHGATCWSKTAYVS